MDEGNVPCTSDEYYSTFQKKEILLFVICVALETTVLQEVSRPQKH